MGKLIDLSGLSEFKTKLLNLIKPQLDASVSTVNDKSATNHAVVINADDIKMSASDTTNIPNKLKQYVKTVNGTAPDPITGDVVVAGGGGDTSVGLIRRSIGIPTTEWRGSGPFTYTYSDPDIAVGMCVLEAYLADEYAQLGINSYTVQNGSLIISTTVKPTADWDLTVALGMDGSSFMEDVSDLKSKVGNGSLDTTATTLIGAVNELNARKGSGITVSNTDSRSIATAIQQIGDLTNLETTAKTDLVSAVNENTEKIPYYQRLPISPSSAIASVNSFDIYKYGEVYNVILDFTVGNANIPIYSIIGSYDNNGILPKHTVVLANIMQDLTAGTIARGMFSLSYRASTLQSDQELTANHRYIISAASI